MRKAYVGFYWTLPAFWLGFRELSADPALASAQSRSIRYQRELIDRHVAQAKGEIVKEEAFMEASPDRGTKAVEEVAGKLLKIARERNAVLALTDFAVLGNWRVHGPLRAFLDEAAAEDPERVDWVEAVPLRLTTGVDFDPRRHFQEWRKAEKAHSAAKPDERLRLVALTAAMGEASLAEKAERLNAEGLKTPTGRLWKAENLRKFLKDPFREPEPGASLGSPGDCTQKADARIGEEEK